MVVLPAKRARQEFSEILSRVSFGRERVIVKRRGKAAAAIVPIDDLLLLEELEDRADIEAAKKALREKGTVAWADLRRELGL
ncbi:MAG: type II toxin-antitoxin system prevent-host-death family antitoxin [Planctomycetota bacterium]